MSPPKGGLSGTRQTNETNNAADALFNSFVKAVNDAQIDIKEFTELMRDETSKQIFAHVEKSEREDPLGIKPWRHTDHPDWFKMDKE